MAIFAELRRLVGFHIEMWKLRGVPVTFGDVLMAFDEARKRSPNSRFAQECRAIAELGLRDVLGVHRFDA